MIRNAIPRGAGPVLRGAVLATLSLASACGRSQAPPEAAAYDTVRTNEASILPNEAELRRFRAALPGEAPAGLTGGAPSRDALVARFLTALEAADTAAFRDMLLTRAEFAWLYYPHTRFTAPPYELAPELLWFQIENGTGRGFGRLLDRMGGRPAHADSYACPSDARTEGPNRVWEECVVRLRPPGGEARDLRLFGTILERDGVYKFVSYSNGF
ncbi:MAG: hypothetical protein FIA95_12105 [Gemmatimonadetes bacterium]|nr:hypothetical protein [Gemmatimonadota bacterium]